jgi:uncharacterized protein (TIGR02246 family)
MKNLVFGTVVCVTLAAAALYAAKGDDDVLRQARDRAEIEDLMWRYTRALDTGNGDAYAAAYTPDGQFSAGTQVTKGRDALKKLATRQPPAAGQPARPPLYHMAANHRVTFTDKDHARIDAYYITASAAGGENTPLRVVAVGRSIDELVRVNGKWLIQSRNVAPQD